MIKFDASLLSVEIVQLKAVTTSLGGSISIIDPTRTTETKEVCKRVEVPMAVTRAFIMKTNKVTKYFKPVYTALVRYGNHIIAMERHPLAGLGKLEEEGLFGTRRWEPQCQRNIENVIKPVVGRGDKDWYFDGRYVYAFEQNDTDVSIRDGQYLTRDGRFRKITAQTIDTQELSNQDKLTPMERSCLAFVASNGASAISPPIWKNLSNVGASHLGKVSSVVRDDETDDDLIGDLPEPNAVANAYNFDRIDESLSVNLNFALKAGNEIGKTFGYEYVEPLQLPRLMIELHTVNLPNVPKEVKATYGVGLQFTHALAWLLGLSRKANTLETHITMRSLMTYLTKKGIFRNNAFDASSVFLPGMTVENVEEKSLDDLIENQDFTKLSLASIMEQARQSKRRGRGSDIHQVGGLLNDD